MLPQFTGRITKENEIQEQKSLNLFNKNNNKHTDDAHNQIIDKPNRRSKKFGQNIQNILQDK